MNHRLLSFLSLFLVLALLSALAPPQARPLAAQAQDSFPPVLEPVDPLDTVLSYFRDDCPNQ